MLKEKDLIILSHLRNNARKSLALISRETEIPVSTLFCKIRKLENNVITKHTSIIDFNKLGYPIRVNFAVKSRDKKKLKEFLLNHKNINSIHRISNYDFFIDVLFRNMNELREFEEELDRYAEKIERFHIVEELKSENFLVNFS